MTIGRGRPNGARNGHGDAFSAGGGTLESWRHQSDAVAEEGLAKLLETHPLVGDTVRAHELRRLRGDFARFLESEQSRDLPSKFMAAEHSFGYAEPAPVELGATTLFVRGRIDRLDVEGKRLVVRDLKTGRAHPRRGAEAGAHPLLDIQIGLYALVMRPMAKALALGLGAAYVYTGVQADRERAFREDIDGLLSATLGWLRIADGLLRERAFTRTPVAEDCTFCPFEPACGNDFHPRVAASLETTSSGALRALRVLRLGDGS